MKQRAAASRRVGRFVLAWFLAAALSTGGCNGLRPNLGWKPPSTAEQQRRIAQEILRSGIQFPHNPAVRAQAVEAMKSLEPEESLPWLRAAALDDHPGVRFAACLALGSRKDETSREIMRKLIDDADDHVLIGAMYALHRLGDETFTSRFSALLLHHNDPKVRRNAALALGLLQEKAHAPLLARAMRDSDAGVRHHALEAMAKIQEFDAQRELIFLANSGVGADEVFAIRALGDLNDSKLASTFRYKLASATHVETRLAAAYALAKIGDDEGSALAIRMFDAKYAPIDDPADPPSDQILRIRQLAAAALGAMRNPAALPVLEKSMHDPDPRIQISAASAVLEILAKVN